MLLGAYEDIAKGATQIEVKMMQKKLILRALCEL